MSGDVDRDFMAFASSTRPTNRPRDQGATGMSMAAMAAQ